MNAPSNKLAGELGKALAEAKLDTTGRTRENSFLQGALTHARRWSTPFAQPVGRMEKQDWKLGLRAAVKEEVSNVGAGSLHLRQEAPEEGGRQANIKFVQLANRTHVGKEAQRMRGPIPPRALRAGVKNPKLGAV